LASKRALASFFNEFVDGGRRRGAAKRQPGSACSAKSKREKRIVADRFADRLPPPGL